MMIMVVMMMIIVVVVIQIICFFIEYNNTGLCTVEQNIVYPEHKL